MDILAKYKGIECYINENDLDYASNNCLDPSYSQDVPLEMKYTKHLPCCIPITPPDEDHLYFSWLNFCSTIQMVFVFNLFPE